MTTKPAKRVRCAVYTRVSTEYGLDQEFNSLDAQHEAAEAYIRSQAHDGWTLIRTRYDDGGYSGGSTERPALQRLLTDIRDRRIDIVVVYKVDRLTRSLADFAILKKIERATPALEAAPERSLYEHVLVDEYQDLNKAEQAVVDLLSTKAAVCVVGDDDQSLYSFKHAHPEGIRTFPKTHPGCTDHALLDCYRCPTGIVAVANALIGHNKDRDPLQLRPVPANGPGEMWIKQYAEVGQEAQAIAAFVDEQINKHGRHPGEILVLAQRRTIGNPIHAALRGRGIPSKSYYQESELDSEGAQERLAIFKLFVNRADRIALRWLLGMGSGDFRGKSYARLRAHCEETGQAPWDALVALADGKISIPYSNPLVERFRAIRNELHFLEEHSDDVTDFVNRWLRAEFTDAGELRILVASLMAAAETPAEVLSQIIEAVTQPEIPPDVTEVRIMSLHKSKGLSSPIVVIAGCIDGLLPAEPEPGTSIAERQALLEEQRRLFYVGITRIKAAPSSNRPGSLLVTGSRTMTLADAMQSGIQPAGVNYGVVSLHLSRFIPELGPSAPAPVAG